MKLRHLILSSLLAVCSSAFAEILVIVHPDNAIGNISKEDANAYFLGKKGTFPDGSQVLVIDQDESSTVREAFYNAVAGKNPSQMNAYWSNLIFTGKGQPPKAVFDDGEVLDLIRGNKNTIGYIDASAGSDGVKVISKI